MKIHKDIWEVNGIPVVKVVRFKRQNRYVVLTNKIKYPGTCRECCLKHSKNCGIACCISFPWETDIAIQLYHPKFVDVGDILKTSYGRRFKIVNRFGITGLQDNATKEIVDIITDD